MVDPEADGDFQEAILRLGMAPQALEGLPEALEKHFQIYRKSETPS